MKKVVNILSGLALITLIISLSTFHNICKANNSLIISKSDSLKKKAKAQPPNPYAKQKLTVKVIPAPGNTFGYDILVDDKPMIHQPNIPGVPGNNGFKTKEDAQKVGEFVIKKMKKNQMPPSVTQEDLKKLKVLNK